MEIRLLDANVIARVERASPKYLYEHRAWGDRERHQWQLVEIIQSKDFYEDSQSWEQTRELDLRWTTLERSERIPTISSLGMGGVKDEIEVLEGVRFGEISLNAQFLECGIQVGDGVVKPERDAKGGMSSLGIAPS